MTNAGPDPPKPCVALIGYRGSGKSEVGEALAALLSYEHIDTDRLIARQAGRSIADIFRTEGEGGFRRREREVIAQVTIERPANAPQTVISTGGGAVLDATNVAHLKSVATVIWLTAPAEELHRRITSDGGAGRGRPALTDLPGLEETRQLLTQRCPHYRQAADIEIDTSGRDPSDVARTIAERL